MRGAVGREGRGGGPRATSNGHMPSVSAPWANVDGEKLNSLPDVLCSLRGTRAPDVMYSIAPWTATSLR